MTTEYSVEEEYRKNSDVSPDDVARLRKWMKMQPHLPSEHVSDLDIVLTYHCSGYSSEVTKNLLDLNYTLRTHLTSFFKDRKITTVEKSLNSMLVAPLQIRSKSGYVCFYCRMLDTNVKNFILVDFARILLMILDLKQYQEGPWPGVMFLFDFAGITLGHLAAFDIQIVQQFIYYVQEALMVNLKGLHVLNAPSYVDLFMAIVKPVMKKELIELLHIHQAGSKTFEEFYPIDALPSSSGDSKGLEQCREEVRTLLKSNQEFFDKESKKRVVESKRPGKPKTITDYFGSVEGSFKKLCVD